MLSDTVKMFDYWAFHNDGTVQFIQICDGEVFDYREYDRVEDAPIVVIDERSWNPSFIGPIRGLRYHGRSYVAPRVGVERDNAVKRTPEGSDGQYRRKI